MLVYQRVRCLRCFKQCQHRQKMEPQYFALLLQFLPMFGCLPDLSICMHLYHLSHFYAFLPWAHFLLDTAAAQHRHGNVHGIWLKQAARCLLQQGAGVTHKAQQFQQKRAAQNSLEYNSYIISIPIALPSWRVPPLEFWQLGSIEPSPGLMLRTMKLQRGTRGHGFWRLHGRHCCDGDRFERGSKAAQQT